MRKKSGRLRKEKKQQRNNKKGTAGGDGARFFLKNIYLGDTFWGSLIKTILRRQ